MAVFRETLDCILNKFKNTIMRTWLSKTMGNVTEKTNDVWTGTLTTNGEKIYEGDFINVTIYRRKYIGKISDNWTVNRKEYNKESNWEITSETYSGFVHYRYGQFYILGPNKRYTKYGKEYETHIEIYHGMTEYYRCLYNTYKIELV